MGRFALVSGLKTKRRSQQAPQHCGDQVIRITERLAGRVKGLTAVFPALLLTGKLASLLQDRTRQEGDQQEHELWRR
jgi:hypothetical protein